MPATRLITLIIIAITLIGCSDAPKYKIGVSQCSNDDWRTKMNEEILREALFYDDIVVEIRSADDDNAKQISDLKYFVDNGFDIIIVAPNEAEALTKPVGDIYRSGKPIIVFDRTINDTTYTAFQGADNLHIGRAAASYALTLVDDPKVIEIAGLPGSSPAIERERGFAEQAQASGKISVLGSAPGNWSKGPAAEVADSMLKAHPEANLIYAHNDRMAIAAAEVASRLGRGDIKIIGIDGSPEIGLKAVADSTIDATFIYPTEGRRLLRTAINILDDKPYDKNAILMSPTAVDLSNAEILLLQNDVLKKETDKVEAIKGRLDEYWNLHRAQTTVLYAVIIIAVLLSLVFALLLRAYWSNLKHRQQIEAQNRELSKQRDELDELYNQLQEATAEKLTFFTNVSHDLRTPLTLIAEPVEQLSQAQNLTSKQQTLVQLANKNVKRLLRLVNQILDIRKYDNGRLALKLTNIDLAAAMREWMAPFAEVAAKRHLKFSMEIAADTDYVTAIDTDKIERVLFNLLSNAFKFTPANGQVSVKLSRSADTVIISVADTGIGIKPEEITQIFDRFFNSSTEVNPNGSGIGLALAKTFVKMHDGDITVQSNVGQGTVFTVTLPIRHTDAPVQQPLLATTAASDAEELAAVEETETEVHEDAPTLLVIDDNADISVLIKSILGDEYTVIRAASGAQGIRMASKYIPDIVICDVMMPGMDGYETCRRLKDEEVTSHIPVLLLTACTQEQQRTAGYESGADGFMSKPFDSAMLKARCRSLLDNRKRILSAKGTQPSAPKAATTAAPAPKNDIDDEFYARFMEVVEQNIGNSDISVEDIAAKLGLSRVQMYRKIKALTNFSPAEILRNTRLEYAARLLKTTERTVSEIAYEVGFTAPGYFAKCYKEYFKESPTDTQNRTSKLSID